MQIRSPLPTTTVRDTGLRAGEGIEPIGDGLGEDVDMHRAVGDEGRTDGGFDGIEVVVVGRSPVFDGVTAIETIGFDGIDGVVVGTRPVFDKLIVGIEVEVVVDGLWIVFDEEVVVVVVVI